MLDLLKMQMDFLHYVFIYISADSYSMDCLCQWKTSSDWSLLQL